MTAEISKYPPPPGDTVPWAAFDCFTGADGCFCRRTWLRLESKRRRIEGDRPEIKSRGTTEEEHFCPSCKAWSPFEYRMTGLPFVEYVCLKCNALTTAQELRASARRAVYQGAPA